MDKPVDKEIEAMKPMETPADVLKAMHELIGDEERDTPRMPEHLFVAHLLPVLTDTSGNVDITVWLDIAGHGFRPIDVYDDATGQTLFRVPSLYVRRPTRPIGDSRNSLALISQAANNYGAQHPAIAQTFLSRQLGSRPVEQEIDWKTVTQWNAILARYGLPPVVKIPAALTSSPAREPSPSVTQTIPATDGQLRASDTQDDF